MKLRAQFELDEFVRGLSVAELRAILHVGKQRLDAVSAVRLTPEEAADLTKRGERAKFDVLKTLMARTGMDLFDAKILVEGFLNGSCRETQEQAPRDPGPGLEGRDY